MEKYTGIFKKKEYWIGVGIGILSLLVYQKFSK